jgi:tetratricopeptide (TPR) repeat protein
MPAVAEDTSVSQETGTLAAQDTKKPQESASPSPAPAVDTRPDYPSPKTNYDFITWANRNQDMGYYNPNQNWDTWIVYYSDSIRRNPRIAAPYFHRGSLYGFQRNYNRAIADYTQAIVINPNYGNAYGHRAIMYYFVQDYGRSWDDVRRAEALGYAVDPQFLERLRADSHRDR